MRYKRGVRAAISAAWCECARSGRSIEGIKRFAAIDACNKSYISRGARPLADTAADAQCQRAIHGAVRRLLKHLGDGRQQAVL